MQCPECGAVTSEADLFCGECGTILATPQATPPRGQERPAIGAPETPLLSPEAPGTATTSVAGAGVRKDRRATVALILGIYSLGSILPFCVPVLSIVACGAPFAAIAAVILGSIVRRDIDARGGLAEDRKRAQLGMFLGIGGLALYLLLIIVGFVLGVGMSLLETY